MDTTAAASARRRSPRRPPNPNPALPTVARETVIPTRAEEEDSFILFLFPILDDDKDRIDSSLPTALWERFSL